MFNTNFNLTYLFIVLFINILTAVMFTSVTVSIAMHCTKKKISYKQKDYTKTILLFSLINCVASFGSFIVMYATYYFTDIGICSISILTAAVIEYCIVKSVIFKRFSLEKKDKRCLALKFIAISAPYYIFLVNSPLLLYMIAVTIDPC